MNFGFSAGQNQTQERCVCLTAGLWSLSYLVDGVCVQCGSLAPAQPSGASCDVFMLPLPFGKGSVERKAWKPALLWSTWRGREAGGLEGSSLTSGVMASSAFQQKWDSSACIQAKNPLWHWDMKAVA